MTGNLKIRLILVIGLAAAQIFCAAPTQALVPGAKAPGFSLPSFKGENVSLDSLKGKLVYVDFWATWCGPCRMSLPWMDAMQKKYGPAGLVILAINEDTKTEDAQKVVRELNPSFTPLIDNKGAVAESFAPPTMPSSYIVDRQGMVHMVHAGFKEVDEAQLEAEFAKLLGNAK